MLFEFSSEVLVDLITICTEDNMNEMPNSRTEVRIGSVMLGPTDFSQLKLQGTFDDNVQPFECRSFKVKPTPLKAKFLALLQTDLKKITFAFIEVFS